LSLDIDRELSPCRGICSATALGDEFCIGCGRILEDVINWNSYSKEKKKEIIRGIKNDTPSTDSPRQNSGPIDHEKGHKRD